MIQLIPLEGIGEVNEGDDLARLIWDAAQPDGVRDRDVVVVTQKVVSKAEGRFAPVAEKDDALRRETRRELRRREGLVISETHHGLICANAGIDASNVPGERVTLLPVDPDASARRIRSRLRHVGNVDVGVLVSDTFGRPWRLGQTDVAIGVAGLEPFIDYVGLPDTEGEPMHATRICIADELAAAAELAMGKTDKICAVVVRGAPVRFGRGSAQQIVRPPEEDLFR